MIKQFVNIKENTENQTLEGENPGDFWRFGQLRQIVSPGTLYQNKSALNLFCICVAFLRSLFPSREKVVDSICVKNSYCVPEEGRIIEWKVPSRTSAVG